MSRIMILNKFADKFIFLIGFFFLILSPKKKSFTCPPEFHSSEKPPNLYIHTRTIYIYIYRHTAICNNWADRLSAAAAGVVVEYDGPEIDWKAHERPGPDG